MYKSGYTRLQMIDTVQEITKLFLCERFIRHKLISLSYLRIHFWLGISGCTLQYKISRKYFWDTFLRGVPKHKLVTKLTKRISIYILRGYHTSCKVVTHNWNSIHDTNSCDIAIISLEISSCTYCPRHLNIYLMFQMVPEKNDTLSIYIMDIR